MWVGKLNTRTTLMAPMTERLPGNLAWSSAIPTPEITPFAHADAGFVRLGGPYKQPYTYGPALTIGGGMDYSLPFLGGHLGLRLFQADYEYFHANFGPQPPFPTGGRANLRVARLSTGLLYHMGSIVPPPPVAYMLHGYPIARVSRRPHNGHRHGDQSEPEKDSNL